MRQDDLSIGSCYSPCANFMMNLCFYLPAGYSQLIHDYYDEWEGKKENLTGYDIMMGDFLKARKERYWIHVLSLYRSRYGR
jgi:hypothetical protein